MLRSRRAKAHVRSATMIATAIGFALLCGSGPARALVLDADPAQSAITPAGGSASPITGSLNVAIGQLPPVSNTTFDLTEIALNSGGYAISLQSIANPGLGVLAPAGNFLIPTLFVSIDDGVTPVDIALANITGLLFARGPSCAYDYCLTSSFEIDTGAGGLLGVSLYAVPEPSTALLVALGLAGVALERRRMSR
jgi:hypothetical protein